MKIIIIGVILMALLSTNYPYMEEPLNTIPETEVYRPFDNIHDDVDCPDCGDNLTYKFTFITKNQEPNQTTGYRGNLYRCDKENKTYHTNETGLVVEGEPTVSYYY